MGSNWETFPLEYCMDRIIDYRGKTPNKTKSGIPLITAKIVKNGSILPIQEYIAEEEYDSWMRRGLPKEGDILLTTEAPMGEVAQLDNRKVALAQRLITLRGKPNFLDNTFLKYLLQSNDVQHQLRGRSSGTTVTGIKQKELRKIGLPIPEFSEQKAIAHILGSLDDKIELNRRMNETLEAMAQALFQSWFVDFDPVIDKALAAGKAIPDELQEKAERRKALGERRRALPKEVLSLFPDEFEFTNETGWEPKGWDARPLSEVAEIIGGGTPSTKKPEYFCEKEIPWLTPKDLSGYPWKFICRGSSDITEDALKNSSARLMPKGTVLFSSRAPIGYIAIANCEVTTNQGFKSLVPRPGMSNEYIYWYLRINTERIESIATGSTFKEVSGSALKGFLGLFPDAALQSEFQKNLQPLSSKMIAIMEQNKSLVSLRDTLLPKLISGELRVPDAEKLVEEAL